jgi:hypothetical protein
MTLWEYRVREVSADDAEITPEPLVHLAEGDVAQARVLLQEISEIFEKTISRV